MFSMLFVCCCILGAQRIKGGKDASKRGVEVEERALHVIS